MLYPWSNLCEPSLWWHDSSDVLVSKGVVPVWTKVIGWLSGCKPTGLPESLTGYSLRYYICCHTYIRLSSGLISYDHHPLAFSLSLPVLFSIYACLVFSLISCKSPPFHFQVFLVQALEPEPASSRRTLWAGMVYQDGKVGQCYGSGKLFVSINNLTYPN